MFWLVAEKVEGDEENKISVLYVLLCLMGEKMDEEKGDKGKKIEHSKY